MCGIFAVLPAVSRPFEDHTQAIEAALERAKTLGQTIDPQQPTLEEDLFPLASLLKDLNASLLQAAGFATIVRHVALIPQMCSVLHEIAEKVTECEQMVDSEAFSGNVERVNASLVELRDAMWALERDRAASALEVRELALGADGAESEAAQITDAAVEAYESIVLSCRAIDRLEVRGRDSAGIAILVSQTGRSHEQLEALLADRGDELFLSGTARAVDGVAVFAYKASAEIGSLGDNTRRIREEIRNDEAFRDLVSAVDSRVAIVAHTRWASVGAISEANTHPIDSCEIDGELSPYLVSVLNGDVDNHDVLRQPLRIPAAITSDTKVIPSLTARAMREGLDVETAFRSVVEQFLGSVAIGTACTQTPDSLYLAVCGGGQGCYIGLADHAFVVASEPYGLAEICREYVRVDGEATSEASGRIGQTVVLSREGAGTLDGIVRRSYGGELLPFSPEDCAHLEVTTRDIDRGEAPHFLLKEISEAPLSLKRTLRGKVRSNGDRLEVQLGTDALPESILNQLRDGTITRIIGIGQGTAYVASRSLGAYLETRVPISVSVKPATEVSGFGLADDMSDTLVVAVSQSGTTTDTNRTVDMIRARGGRVVAVVNRRQSDLTEKADGVLYTSDGRDVEMSVASTKAFYAQVAACTLLGIAIAQCFPQHKKDEASEILQAFAALPEAMGKVLAKREEIGEIARRVAPSKKSWAIVGNGVNHIAAHEVRIKLSELCYKSIAFDITEDKKHIDLSAEPMILVCAAGLTGSTASDVVKEVSIYAAHKAKPVVVCSEGEEFAAAAATVTVPRLHPHVDFVLSTMVGHLFGYEAAKAIDAQGRLLRRARSVIEEVLERSGEDEDRLWQTTSAAVRDIASEILRRGDHGEFDGHLESRTAVRVALGLRYAMGDLPLELFERETGAPSSPRELLMHVVGDITQGIDELTRPIDAVKHQAKTVTVGISRTEDTVADTPLFQAVLDAGAPRNALGYRTVRTLAALDAAVGSTVGFTRYHVEGARTEPLLRVVAKGGVAEDIPSRVDEDPRLSGTKHRAAQQRLVTVGRGARDNRSVVIVPEVADGEVCAITLLHVEFRDVLEPAQSAEVLKGYQNRYSALRDAVMEMQPHFDETRLGEISILDLLTEPVHVLARHWA